MGKSNFLAGLKAAADAVNPFTPDLAKDITSVEAKLAALREQRGPAALHVHQQLPGSVEKLMQVDDAIQAGERTLANLKDAQRALQADLEARRAKDTAAANARQDKVSQATFDAYAAWAQRGQETLAGYVAWWQEGLVLRGACQAQLPLNPRIREDFTHVLAGQYDHVSREFARQGALAGLETNALPPGADQRALTTDPRKWPPLSKHYADIAKAIFRKPA